MKPVAAFMLAIMGMFLATGCSTALQHSICTSCATQPKRLYLAAADQWFDPFSTTGLLQLQSTAEHLVALSKSQEVQFKHFQQNLRVHTPLHEMPADTLRQHYWPPEEFITKKERRGLKKLSELSASIINSFHSTNRHSLTRQLFEVACALANNRRSPAPESVDVLQMPVLLADYYYNPIGRGGPPAANLKAQPGITELDKLDPLPSTFWTPPLSIPSQNLYAGFGRDHLPRLEQTLWQYAKPKTSYGGNPGVELKHDNIEIKVKFAETQSEPFTARIFHALGYHADPTDYAAHIKIQYDRRFFREFHLRKPISTQFRLAGIPQYRMHLQKRFDPFTFIQFAVLKDGSQVPGSALKAKLLIDPTLEHPEDDPLNFDTEFEARIEYLVTVPANVQPEDGPAKSIGPWDFSQLGHQDLRELRGAALLAAWLGWFDSRFENTRLKIVHHDGQERLQHFFSDLGGGLGQATHTLAVRPEEPNLFGWIFTSPPRFQGKGLRTIPFQIVGFQPFEDTAAFDKMSVDDARWMARLIAQLSEEQIVQALTASGFSSAEIRLYTEKLVSRRDQMIRDLGLAHEIGLLRPQGTNRSFSYDPKSDGAVEVTLPNGEKIAAPEGAWVVRQGRLEPRPNGMSTSN